LIQITATHAESFRARQSGEISLVRRFATLDDLGAARGKNAQFGALARMRNQAPKAVTGGPAIFDCVADMLI
jgi:hypothetical protein